MSFFIRFVIKAVALKVFLALLVLFFVVKILRARSANNKYAIKLKLFKALFVVISLIYAPISADIARIFACVNIDGTP